MKSLLVMYRQREGNLLVCIATCTTVCGCVKGIAQPPHVYLITCLVWTLFTEIFFFPSLLISGLWKLFKLFYPATPLFLLTQRTYCTVDEIFNCMHWINFVADAGSEDGAAVSNTDRTSEQISTEETPREREASSNSTGMNEWSGERWDTVTDVCSWVW